MEAREFRSAESQFRAGNLPPLDELRKKSKVLRRPTTPSDLWSSLFRCDLLKVLPTTADAVLANAVLIAHHTRPAGMGVDLKGGRWTKNWCGGVQQWRTCLSGHVWAGRLRSGWLRSPPH